MKVTNLILVLFVLNSLFFGVLSSSSTYWGIDVVSTGVELPDGCSQALWLYGAGINRFTCAQKADGNFSWVLSEIRADLWRYRQDGTLGNLKNRDVEGVIGFDVIGQPVGSNPYFVLGFGCRSHQKMSDSANVPNCQSPTGFWTPVNADMKAAASPGNIPWNLRPANVSRMAPTVYNSFLDKNVYNSMWNYPYNQRLQTSGGLPSGTCSQNELGQKQDSPFSADFLFAFCDFTVAADATVALPSDCFQALILEATGAQVYRCFNSTWLLNEPKATLYGANAPLDASSSQVGSHGFEVKGSGSSAGSAPFWEVGPSCFSSSSCPNPAGIFTGAKATKVSPQAGTIPWLLVPKNSNSSLYKAVDPNLFSEFEWIQRLNTQGGAAPTEACTTELEGVLRERNYSATYVLALCGTQPTQPTDSAASSVLPLFTLLVFFLSFLF